MTLTLEAPHAMTRIRTPNLSPRVKAMQVAALARNSGKGVREAREHLCRLAWDLRVAGDWDAYRDVMGHLRELRGRTKADKWRPTDVQRRQRAHLREHSPMGVMRLADQQIQAPHSPTRSAVQEELSRRDAERWAANAVALALWAVHQGERSWEAIPTRPTTLQASAPRGEPSSSVSGPAQLTVRVPARREHAPRTLILYRADYDRLLALWGYGQVVTAERHSEVLLKGTRGLTSSLTGRAMKESVAAITELALQGCAHPNLARSWHGYVTGARLGDVFAEHSSGSVQLAPRRSGDLREAALEIARQCREVPPAP